jgi:hypothetical protein
MKKTMLLKHPQLVIDVTHDAKKKKSYISQYGVGAQTKIPL